MSTVTLRFNRVVVNSQAHRTTNDHMVSVVEYVILVNGANLGFHQSLIRQPAGGDMQDLIEVSPPDDYAGPMDYQAFRDAVEGYFRSCVGPEGRGVRMPWEAVLTMNDVIFGFASEVTFEAEDG